MYTIISEEQSEIINSWIKNNPGKNFKEFRTEHPKVQISEGGFRHRRVKLESSSRRISKNNDIKTKILNYVRQHKEGVTTNEIKQKFKISSQTVYTAVHFLNKNGTTLRYDNKKYFVAKNEIELSPKKEIESRQKNHKETTVFDKEILEKLSVMSLDDQRDYLDMKKKAIFYSLGADAILKANEIIKSVAEKLNINNY